MASNNRRYLLATALILVLITVTAGTVLAYGALLDTYSAPISFTGYGPPYDYTNDLTAQIFQNSDGSYHYLYTLIYAESFMGSSALSDFSVGNLDNLAFTSQGSDYSFYNSPSNNSVLWVDGNVPMSTTVHFWYDSFFPWTKVDISSGGGLDTNTGKTFGMTIPEPASIGFLVLGAGGLLWKRLRLKR